MRTGAATGQDHQSRGEHRGGHGIEEPEAEDHDQHREDREGGPRAIVTQRGGGDAFVDEVEISGGHEAITESRRRFEEEGVAGAEADLAQLAGESLSLSADGDDDRAVAGADAGLFDGESDEGGVVGDDRFGDAEVGSVVGVDGFVDGLVGLWEGRWDEAFDLLEVHDGIDLAYENEDITRVDGYLWGDRAEGGVLALDAC